MGLTGVQNGYTQHHVHVYGIKDGQEGVLVEDCTIWIGRLDNPAFGKSLFFLVRSRRSAIYRVKGVYIRGKIWLTESCSRIRTCRAAITHYLPAHRTFRPQQSESPSLQPVLRVVGELIGRTMCINSQNRFGSYILTSRMITCLSSRSVHVSSYDHPDELMENRLRSRCMNRPKQPGPC